jgi:HEAT repeat protein
VVEAFREGNLASRLTALELLRDWRAPVEGIDPWRPETINDERLSALEKWTDEAIGEQPGEPEELSQPLRALARSEIERMLQSTDAEAGAIRERLARLGPALLSEVYDRLKQASADRDRHRLLALRYRLVADGALVLRWPGGVTRLAATDPQERQQAAEELAGLATGDDQPLLLELFSDPDPLVREISLRGLQHIGGKQATAALVKLLADPEPNVRAAVLKQLEEDPRRSMVPKVAEYLKTEEDSDLIVHAIRFLRAAGGPESLKSLMSLLDHESWQVRAEAAAGIGGSEASFESPSYGYYPGDTGFDTGDEETAALQADAYVALLELLDDPDAFVVSRAVAGLADVDMAVAVEPLVEAAVRHPELAEEIVEILARGENMRPKALRHLRSFCAHADPGIRAAAVGGLCQAAPQAVEEELARALEDPESMVRTAAALALFRVLERARSAAASEMDRALSRATGPFSGRFGFDPFDTLGPGMDRRELAEMMRMLKRAQAAGAEGELETSAEGELGVPPIAGDAEDKDTGKNVEDLEREGPAGDTAAADGTPADDQPDAATPALWDDWLEDFHAGRGRPKWFTEMIAPLEAMLQADRAEERIAAARALVPLGKADVALPVLLAAARSNAGLFDDAIPVLPWLLWDDRLDAFLELRDLARGEGDLSTLIRTMADVPDQRATGVFWELLADEKLTLGAASALRNGLLTAQFGSPYFDASDLGARARREFLEEAKPRALAGTELQRLTALALLASVAPDAAAEVAAEVADDARLDDGLRRDAFQVLLVTLPDREATQRAVAAMSAGDSARRRLALVRLVEGADALGVLRDVMVLGIDIFGPSRYRGGPIVPEPPPGLEPHHVRPLLDDPDSQTAAYAGYLLALLGEEEGLGPLLQHWHAREEDDRQLSRLVYRAIAALNDPSRVSVLEEIYAQHRDGDVSEFYWTIRIMSGPEILRLRKKIRDDVGMSNLR